MPKYGKKSLKIEVLNFLIGFMTIPSPTNLTLPLLWQNVSFPERSDSFLINCQRYAK